MSKLDEQLTEIAGMDKAEMQDRWFGLTGRTAPRVSPAMLRLAVAYELQAKALGGLPRKAKRQLDAVDVMKTVTTDIRPGMRLAREHGGTDRPAEVSLPGDTCRARQHSPQH